MISSIDKDGSGYGYESAFDYADDYEDYYGYDYHGYDYSHKHHHHHYDHDSSSYYYSSPQSWRHGGPPE